MENRLHWGVWPDGVPKHVKWPQGTLYDNLAKAARDKGNRTAILYHGARLTYSELDAQVVALAGYMQQVCGIRKGDRVLLFMQNCPQFVIGYYAILRADAVVVPINPMSQHAELLHIVQDTGARLALTGQELMDRLLGLVAHQIVATYPESAAADRDIPLPDDLDQLRSNHITTKGVTRWTDAMQKNCIASTHLATKDDLAVIPYSSGTTGQPKGCMHSHFTVNVTAYGGVIWNYSDETDVSLASLPLFHVTGMQAAMNGPILVGGSVAIMTRWNRETAARLIARHRVTRWRSIATMAIDLVNAPELADYDLTSLTTIGGGGAAMPEAIAKRLFDRTGLHYVEGYGLSETMAATHLNPPTAPRRQCLGIPVFDVDSRVIDPETLVELPQGEVGEIISHGPQVFLGYWQRPEETEAAFITLDGKQFLRTGDLGYIDPDGYFYMVDRVKRMINASGFKVWPAEVETLMHLHPQIAEVCVIGYADARRGETVRAVIVPKPEAKDGLTEADIITWCKANMAAYKCPTSIVFADALPKSGTGKVLWRELTHRMAQSS